MKANLAIGLVLLFAVCLIGAAAFFSLVSLSLVAAQIQKQVANSVGDSIAGDGLLLRVILVDTTWPSLEALFRIIRSLFEVLRSR